MTYRDFERLFTTLKFELARHEGYLKAPNQCSYVSEILPEEIEIARHRRDHGETDVWPGDDVQCDCLVLLLGHTLDPLLQAVCAYQPSVVVVVANKHYNTASQDKGGNEHVDELKQKLEEVAKKQLATLPLFWPERSSESLLDKDRPESVFRFLQKHLLEDREELANKLETLTDPMHTVIDITGAKKSMVGGAFAFAMHSNSVITYTDFDLYDTIFGRPLGYSCRISRLEDPFKLFQVQAWQRVQELYERHSFDASIDEMDDLMRRETLFSHYRDEIETLKKALEFLGQWNNGQFVTARKTFSNILQETDVPCPAVIELLGNPDDKRTPTWPDRPEATQNPINQLTNNLENLSEGESSIYRHDEHFLAYVVDEIFKIERLIKYQNDFRSAFLRAHGIHEMLLKCRLMKLWYSGELQLVKPPRNEGDVETAIRKDELGDAGQKAAAKALANASSPSRVFGTLRTGKGNNGVVNVFNLKWKNSENEIIKHEKVVVRQVKESERVSEFYLDPENSETSLSTKQLNASTFSELRNKAIHFCLSLNEDIARLAVKHISANLEEFLGVGRFADSTNVWVTKPELRESVFKFNTGNNAINPGKFVVSDTINDPYPLPRWGDLTKWCGLKFLPNNPPQGPDREATDGQ